MKYANNGGAIARLSIATSEQWTDKGTGNKQERTEWHRVVFFGRLAEIAGEYLRKGSQVYIEGSLRTDKYTDANGVDKYSTDIVGREMQMLGGRGENTGGMGSNMNNNAANNGLGPQLQRHAPQPQQQQTQQGQAQQNANGTFGTPPSNINGAPPQNTDFDDDIPFVQYQKGWVV